MRIKSIVFIARTNYDILFFVPIKHRVKNPLTFTKEKEKCTSYREELVLCCKNIHKMLFMTFFMAISFLQHKDKFYHPELFYLSFYKLFP